MWPLFCKVLNVLSSFAIISLRKRRLVALLHLYFCCHSMCVCSVSLPRGAVAYWSAIFGRGIS